MSVDVEFEEKFPSILMELDKENKDSPDSIHSKTIKYILIDTCLDKQTVKKAWGKFKEGLKLYPFNIIKAEEFEKEAGLK